MVTFHVLYRKRRGKSALGGEPLPTERPVSILKPLAGRDDDLEANLESFALLDGYAYEILFGVASATDPAHAAARAFIARHPEVDARVVLTDASAATNPKIAQLIALAERARGDVLVISDSNVRVDREYLLHVLSPLSDPRCGLVTNLFAGTGERTLGAALENLQLAAMVAPSVVLSTLAQPITVGKSMAIRKRDLATIGGFAAFENVLAEDLMIGRAITRDAKLEVATSFHLIENRNVTGTIAKMFDRHARWTKMRRSISPGFCALEPLFSPVLVALVATALSPTRSTFAMFGLALIIQTITAFAAARTLRGRPMSWRYLPLELVRVFVLFACWVSAWASRTVIWRGNAFTIGAGSVIAPVSLDLEAPHHPHPLRED